MIDFVVVRAVLIEMASDESSAATRLEEAARDGANGSDESSTSKVAAEEVEDKVDDLTLDEPQGYYNAPICSYLFFSIYYRKLLAVMYSG